MSGTALVRWRSVDRRGVGHGGALAAASLQRLVEQRFSAGDRSLVATLAGEEVAWITHVDGRRTYSYDRTLGEVQPNGWRPAMSSRPARALTESVAADIVRDAQSRSSELGRDTAALIAVQLADEVLARGGWKANTCAPLLRAYQMALEAHR